MNEGAEEALMIGIGVVGYGYWGPNLVRNFAQHPASRVVAVCDRREDRLAECGERVPGARLTGQYGELLDDPQVEAVAIATPVSTHHPLAMRALAAGKHVLVEKPMTRTTAEADELIEAARRADRVLMVDHVFVYTAAVRKIRELIDAGELGELLYFDGVRVNLGLFQSDVNVLWDLAPHDLSILQYLIDADPTAVGAIGLRHIEGRPENLAYLTVFYGDSFLAHVHVNWLAPVKVRTILIGGSKKMVVYDDTEADEKIKVYDKGVTVASESDERAIRVSYRAGDMWAPRLDRYEALREVCDHFLACIREGGEPLTGGEAGRDVVRILEAAERSMAADGVRVPL